MGRKGGKYRKKENNGSVKKYATGFDSDEEDMINDEIDAFHKQRDVVPLNVNEDLEESDEDNEQPVFDIEDDEDDSTENDGDDYDDEDEDGEDDKPPKGLAAQIARTLKYMQAKSGGVEDEILDDQEQEEEPKVWKKQYGADVNNEPQSSDEEDAAEEEAEVMRLQSEKTKGLSLEDFGLEDASQDMTEEEASFKEIMDGGKLTPKASFHKEIKDDPNVTYEIVKKDLNSLTKEEQMNIVYSSAPELVGLLSELKDALEQLENKVNPLVSKIKGQESAKMGVMHYIEVKQLLLQSFCQAITFYLLLKSEGHSVRDHPVVSRLVEIKSLLDKMKEIDVNLPFDVEDLLSKDLNDASVVQSGEGTTAPESDSLTISRNISLSSEERLTIEPNPASALNSLRTSKTNESECKPEEKSVGRQSMEMLKVRAGLEEKLKQKGVFSSFAPQNVRARETSRLMNRQLETLDDFDDEVMEIDRVSQARDGDASKSSWQLAFRMKKRKVISGDDDIPKRDDIGERRNKHELKVLAGAGIKSVDDIDDKIANNLSDESGAASGESDSDSASEYYEQRKLWKAAKDSAKSNKQSRTSDGTPLQDTAVDGKRLISYQMEKNRGLTRARNKKGKNPRKKYRLKHESARTRRKGQVRDIRKPTGPYGGEASGINTGISRSIRFKN